MAFGMISRPRPVLIVDDDIETLAVERQLLAENGFRVVEARDGAEALRAVQEDPPAVVVLDVQMPGMDGPSFARELRMALRRVPLVILTGVADPRREADRCNAEAYLSKPFDAQPLVSVGRHCAPGRLLRPQARREAVRRRTPSNHRPSAARTPRHDGRSVLRGRRPIRRTHRASRAVRCRGGRPEPSPRARAAPRALPGQTGSAAAAEDDRP